MKGGYDRDMHFCAFVGDVMNVTESAFIFKVGPRLPRTNTGDPLEVCGDTVVAFRRTEFASGVFPLIIVINLLDVIERLFSVPYSLYP